KGVAAYPYGLATIARRAGGLPVSPARSHPRRGARRARRGDQARQRQRAVLRGPLSRRPRGAGGVAVRSPGAARGGRRGGRGTGRAARRAARALPATRGAGRRAPTRGERARERAALAIPRRRRARRRRGRGGRVRARGGGGAANPPERDRV